MIAMSWNEYGNFGIEIFSVEVSAKGIVPGKFVVAWREVESVSLCVGDCNVFVVEIDLETDVKSEAAV